MSGEGETFYSGGPGSTGREVFEHSTATGPGPGYGRDHGESATTGFEGADGIGAGGHVHHHHDTSGGQPDKTGSFGHELVGGTAGSEGRETEGADPHAPQTGASIPGTAGTGGGIPPPAEGHHHHHHHHGHHGQQSGIGGAETSQIGDSYGANTGGLGAAGQTDRVGDLNQGGAMYERTTDQGPQTTGAAGTDRFDSSDRSGVTGNSYGASDEYPQYKEATTRAEGKATGGIMGVLGTSDKDFTGRDRLGGADGAYADTDGRFQNNTTGPGGSALTGREGNVANNPVANAGTNMSSANDSDLVSHTSEGTGKNDNMLVGEGEAPKKGFTQKLKEVFSA